jgi:hypothetical protein
MHEVSEAVAYSRLLRPYSVKRLSGAVYHVNATANTIDKTVTRLLIDTPVDAAEWTFELAQLQNMLETLSEQCEQAWTKLDLLARSAEGDYERAITAMTRVLQGISAVGPPEGTGEAPALHAA